MTDYVWVRIRSWHLSSTVRPMTTAEGRVGTLCGRLAPVGAPVGADYLSDEATCESCLRVFERETGQSHRAKGS